MSYYRLYYFSPRSHGIVKFDEIEGADDAAALAVAETCRGAHALELWCGHRLVAQIEARDLASRRTAVRANGTERGFQAAE